VQENFSEEGIGYLGNLIPFAIVILDYLLGDYFISARALVLLLASAACSIYLTTAFV